MNKRLKSVLAIGYFFLLVFILPLIIQNNFIRFLPIIILVSIFVSIFGFGKEPTKFILVILVFGFFIVGILVLWFTQKSFLGVKFDNQAIIAFFTIVLATATIINVFVYNRSIHMSRFPVLELTLNKKTLVLEIENVSNFPARNVEVEIDVGECGDISNAKGLLRVIKENFTGFNIKF
ncbi:hypothetical protein LCGC14_0993830 [marine sediment metagenome]|uniref:Uncharacterized protein n=1 Tax=marine sediment metagenome TaxID=412755 RepID=A0A0F9NRC3_9ZZZZ